MANVRSYVSNWLSSNSDSVNVKYIIAVTASAGLLYGTYLAAGKYLRQKYLWTLVTKKRQLREKEIAQLKRQLERVDEEKTVQRKRIAQLKFDELRSSLQNGTLTAVETLEAFQWRALEVHEKTNFACQFILEARRWAEELDNRYKDGGNKPPLFGIPVSIKECVYVAGCHSTGGYAQFAHQPVEEDADMVVILKRAGAVPFVTTNVLTTMGSFGCSNLLFGYTTNPHNPTRTSGGSSAGEGAAVGARASPLGLGTDIGGSARTPAHLCGASSLKPTYGRIPRGKAARVAARGLTAVKATFGPMGADVDSVVWFMRAMCDSEQFAPRLDPYAARMPFNEGLFKDTRKLRIGYYYSDNWLTPVPACQRAVTVAKDALQRAGHTMVPLQFPFASSEMHSLMAVFVAAAFPDAGVLVTEWLSRDLMDSDHKEMYSLFSSPVWWRKLKSMLTSSPYWRTLYSACERDTAALRAKYAAMDEYRMEFFKFWRQNGLDCLICPGGPSPALPVDVVPKLLCIPWSYGALYNLLEYPAGVVKCATVTKEDELAALSSASPKEDSVVRLVRECQRGTAGLPVGVQVVALPFEEELCLRVMKEIESEVRP